MNKSRLQTWYQSWQPWLPWLDGLVLLLWGGLFLYYTATDKLGLLIHPNYFSLTAIAGVVLLGLGGLRFWYLFRGRDFTNGEAHISLFPPGGSQILLLVVAIAGLLVSPTVLSSQTAIQRGLTEGLPLARSQPQAFRTQSRPENRNLIEWIRTLNAYPEPDAYVGQPVRISGFVTHLASLPENYVMVSRFVLTCCAVDAYPVGLPVQLPAGKTRQDFPQDRWVKVEGSMGSQTLATTDPQGNPRRSVVEAAALESIPTPTNPYEYKQ